MEALQKKPEISKTNDNLRLKFSMLYFLACGAMACYYPFMALYYQSRNLDYSQIGKIFAINSLVAVIAQPLWGIVTDKYLNKKKSLFIVLSASSALVIGFAGVQSFTAIAVWIVIFMSFQSPLLSLNDAYCYEAIDTDRTMQYGKVRMVGSIGYAIIALVLAILIARTRIEISFYAYAIFGVLSILVLRSIKVHAKASKSTINLYDITDIIKNRKFLILSFSALLTSACMNANGNYLAILIQKTGGDTSNIGFLWFVVAISELPAFFIGAKLMKRYGALNLYLVGLLFYISRFLLDSFCGDYHFAIAIQLMQAITYPLFTLATLQYVSDIVPDKARTTAITVFAAFTSGIGGFLGNMTGAAIIKNASVFVMFRSMAAVIVIAFAVGLLLKAGRTGDRKSSI